MTVYPKETCGLRKAVSYSAFMASLHSLASVYGTVEAAVTTLARRGPENVQFDDSDEEAISDADDEDNTRIATIEEAASQLRSRSASPNGSVASSGRSTPIKSGQISKDSTVSPYPSSDEEEDMGDGKQTTLIEERYAGPRDIQEMAPLVFTLPCVEGARKSRSQLRSPERPQGQST
jgi:hypothetical protein